MTASSTPISLGIIDVLTMQGHGIFECSGRQYKTDFCLHRQLSRVVITLIQSTLGDCVLRSETFSLAGSLSDGRSITVEELWCISALEGGLIELIPRNCPVEIGSQSNCHPIESTFALTSLYDGDFRLTDGEWDIELCSDSKARTNKRVSLGLKIPLEGSTLKIGAQGKSRDDHQIYAWGIMLLLSLACGTGITSHRWRFIFPGSEQLELWRSRLGDEIGPGPIIETCNLKTYLAKTLPAWNKMPEDKRNTLKIAILHLNNSGTGYIDNRLFQVTQIWEYLAQEWMPETSLSDDLKQLKTDVMTSYRQWKKENPQADPHGQIGGRISQAFHWPILRRQIEGLAAHAGLSLTSLGFDIDHLKNARDSVAHSITLNEVTPTSGPHDELLISAQYALQLLLLLRLSYSGLVVYYENGWSCPKDIDTFLAN